MSHTRASDEQLLLQFVIDNGGYKDEKLKGACSRLLYSLKYELSDYSVPLERDDMSSTLSPT